MPNLRSPGRPLLIFGVVVSIILGFFWGKGLVPLVLHSGAKRVAFDLINLPGLRETEQDQQFSLAQWKEPYLIVHFWASWCQPCREEFPSMIQASAFLPESVKIITVSADQDRQQGLQFFQMFEGSERLVSLWDSKQEISRLWGGSKLPETYILGPDRQLVRKIAGTMNWMDSVNLRYLQTLGSP